MSKLSVVELSNMTSDVDGGGVEGMEMIVVSKYDGTP